MGRCPNAAQICVMQTGRLILFTIHYSLLPFLDLYPLSECLFLLGAGRSAVPTSILLKLIWGLLFLSSVRVSDSAGRGARMRERHPKEREETRFARIPLSP